MQTSRSPFLVASLASLFGFCVVGSCSKSSTNSDANGGSDGDQGGGGQGGDASGGSQGGKGGAGGQGGAGQGGAGGMGGKGTVGGGAGGSGGAMSTSGGSGGSPDAGMAMDAPSGRACKGTVMVGSGTGAQVLRTDMAVRKVLDTPDDTTRLTRDPVSKKLFLMTENGTISRLDVAGQTWTRQVAYSPADIGLASGEKVYGLGFSADGTLYLVSNVPKVVSPNTSKATVWKGKPGAAGARTWTKLAQTEAYGRSSTIFDHEWSGIAASPDGKFVYINAGSRTDHGEEHLGTRESALTAKIFKLPTDKPAMILLKDNLTELKTAGYVFAEGVRNSFDPEFAPNGDLLAGDNGPDADYHEELNFLQEGKHYGFPWRLGNEDNQMQFANYDINTDKRRDSKYEAIKQGYWRNDPLFPAKPNVTMVEPIMNTGMEANQYRDPVSGQIKTGTIGTFSDHGSPLGLTFDLGAGDLCGSFNNAAFILRNGRAAGDFEEGRDLLMLDLTKNGGAYTQVKVTQLLKGFQSPVDAVLTGDKMWVLDRSSPLGGGKLWEIDMPNGK